MMKFASFLLVFSFFTSCVTTPKTASKPPRYQPNFDFTPPERQNPSSEKITIALINPVFADGKPERLVAPYSEFIDNMANDFEEMLIAKGFTLRGPFRTRDEMVYSDKVKSDIALEIKVSLKEDGTLNLNEKKQNIASQILSTNTTKYYTVAGNFSHFGNLILEATDPFSGEKFWKKSVSLPREQIVCQGAEVWTGRPTANQMLAQDVGIYNPIAKALESYYQEALTTAWRHLDKEELGLIKNEIKKSKE